ncbi:hypothetical protein [Enterococcus villorum]|uniref:Uncharacterized protein n=1 Tax=Enterococcus villorum TaxID=112904 RepID=A0A511IYT2_9ENTE|nr:hypothetical protein EVI01_02830 [Enterococcus villorum]
MLIWAQSYACNFYDYKHIWLAVTYDILEFGKSYKTTLEIYNQVTSVTKEKVIQESTSWIFLVDLFAKYV